MDAREWDKLNLQNQLLQEEIALKKVDTELKRRELDFEENREARRNSFFTPVNVAILVAVIGVLGTAITSVITSYYQRQASYRLQRQEFESELIKTALSQPTPDDAIRSLEFAQNLGLFELTQIDVEALRASPDSVPAGPIGRLLVDVVVLDRDKRYPIDDVRVTCVQGSMTAVGRTRESGRLIMRVHASTDPKCSFSHQNYEGLELELPVDAGGSTEVLLSRLGHLPNE